MEKIFGLNITGFKQRVWAILKYRACSTCYHSQAFGALCACREKVDMIQHNCPDWHAKIKKEVV